MKVVILEIQENGLFKGTILRTDENPSGYALDNLMA